jgi:hypothetical protein
VSALPIRFLSLAILLGSTVVVPAETPRAADTKSTTKESPTDKTIESLRLSSDAVVIVVDQAMDALKLAPRFVVLTPEKWKEINAELTALRAKLAPEKAPTPSSIEIKGKIEGNVATLTLQFVFATERANVLVPIGCGQGTSINVVLDGSTPGDFKRVGDGWGVLVEKAKTDHQLTVELLVQLAARGTTGRGLLLDLPRAPTTTIKELTLPAGIKDLRAGDRALSDTFLKLDGATLSGALGIVDRLDLNWRSAGAPSATGPVLNVKGAINVRVEEVEKIKKVLTEAELTLEPQGGPAAIWKLLLPPTAVVKVALDEKRYRLEQDPRNPALHSIVLSEPTEEPFKVTVKVEVPLRIGVNTPTPIGPFLVVGAMRQSGSLVVSSTVSGLRLECLKRGDLSQRDLTDEEKRHDGLEAFTYRVQAPPNKLPMTAAALALLELEATIVQYAVDARSVNHTLKLMRDENGWQWQLLTTIDAQPSWNGADRFTMQLPPDWELDERNPPAQGKRVQKVEWEADRRLVVFRLTKGGSDALDPFQVVLKANGPRARDADTVALALPRPVAALDRGGLIVVQAPEELELLGTSANLSLQLSEQTAHRQTWRLGPASDRLPERITVSWRPYRPEIQATSEADLKLGEREGEVWQTFRLKFATDTTQFDLLVPEAVGANVNVEAGGTLEGGIGNTRTVHLKASAGREHILVLKYFFEHIPQAGRLLRVPLIVPAVQARGEARLRVWTEQGPLPINAGKDWEDRPIEAVPGKPSLPGLPVLVLSAFRLNAPLTLKLGEGSSSPVTVLIKHGLARVEVTDGGQNYRISYLVKSLAAKYLDLEMPAPVAGINLGVTFKGDDVKPDILDSESGRPADAGRVARLRLPRDLGGKPAILEVQYHLPPVRGGVLQTTLRPPVVRGDSGQVPLRWQVVLPPSWVVLGPECGEERAWGRRGWWLAPHPALTTRDLEMWFAGNDLSPAVDEEAPATPSLVVWGVSGETLTVWHAPQWTWIIVCSMALVVLGVAGLLSVQPGANGGGSALVGLLTILLTTAAIIAALLWPTLMASVAYACEPGALILLFVALVKGLLHVRYRRQIVFLPSFSRARSGSSLMRNSAQRPLGEPSTVDAPRPGGSKWPGAEAEGG